MRQHKGFMLWEIILGILIMGYLSSYLLKSDAIKTEKEKINLMYETILDIVNTSIYNQAKGYASDKGGYCSNNFDVKNISAARIKDCNSLDFNVTRGTDDTDGSESYFTFLKQYSKTDEGCKVYFDDDSSYGISIFLDCSKIDNNLGKIEQSFVSFMRDKKAIGFKKIYFDATSITVNTGGTSEDGKVKIVIEE